MTLDGVMGRVRLDRLVMGAIALVLLIASLVRPPQAPGDAIEYYLMSESLLNHGSPDLAPRDIQSFARRVRGEAFGFRKEYQQAFFPASNGRWYGYHFWAYSLFAVPAKFVLRHLGVDELKAHQVTNALLFAMALLALADLGGRGRAFAALALLSPVVPLVFWTHPEVFSFVWVTLSLVCMERRRDGGAVLCASIASLQNTPLVLFAVWLWIRRALRVRIRFGSRWTLHVSTGPGLIGLTLALLPAAAPFLFYWRHYGTPSLLASISTSSDLISARRAAELLVDFNLGLLPYVPFALLLALLVLAIASVHSLSRGRLGTLLGLAAVVWLMMLMCSAAQNWNHGSSGPSRYGIWLLPFVLYLATLAPETTRLGPRAYQMLVGLALVSQAFIFIRRGGLAAPVDYCRHSYAARAVLHWAPAAYRPTPEIFIERTAGREEELRGPYIYADDRGCRKAYVKRKHAAALQSLCGPLPEEARGWFGESPADRQEEREWRYVDF